MKSAESALRRRARAALGTLHRVRSADRARAADAALVALVAVLSVAPLVGTRPFPWYGWPMVAAECLALLGRRRWPLAAGLLAGAVTAVHSVTAVPEPVLPWASLVAIYSVARHASPRRSAVAAAVTALAVPSVLLLDPHPLTVEGLVASVVVYAAAWLLGDAARHRLERTALLRQRAVADERARLAREMHDAVGHQLSLVIVQAEAGPALLDRSPAAAVAAFDHISAAGRQALDELRQVVRALRDGGGDPAAGVAGLPHLLDRVRAAGLDVSYTTAGTVTALPPAVDRAVFRVVQEGLTNVVRHAGGGAAAVSLVYGDGAVRVGVFDGGGSGLAGLRERVEALGGRFQAGPAAGGWAVEATLPAPDERA